MDKINKIRNELKEISPLLRELKKINIFKVPENYFDNLAEKIKIFVFLNQDKTDFDIHSRQQVPENYFDTLSDQILLKIKKEENESAEDELQRLSPLLSSLKEKNVFTVPSGYFETISNTVISQLTPKPAKVIPMSAKWWKYAAAAVITAAIAISSLQIFNGSVRQKNNSVATKSGSLPGYIESSFQYKTPEQVDEGIASLSEDEIVKYLEKHGNIMDNDILLKNIDEKKLPSPTDYLTDDNALNNYLNNIDKSTDRKTP